MIYDMPLTCPVCVTDRGIQTHADCDICHGSLVVVFGWQHVVTVLSLFGGVFGFVIWAV